MPQQSQSLSGILPPGAPIAGTLRQAEILIADLERMNYDATPYKSALSSLVDAGRNSQTQEEVMRVAGSIQGVLSELQSLAKTTLSDAEPVEPKPAFGEISNSIQSLLQLGEENNIRVSPSLIENAFRAELAGDEGKAFNVLKSIEQEVQKGRDMQADEEKENVTLADGSQISRGKKSGTLYRNGVPVSQGAINTGTYNKVVESITGVGGEEQALQSKPSIAFTASPETYDQALTPTFRAATPEEAAQYGAATGQIDESTGRFYPAPQTQGRTTRFNPENGQFEIIEGVDNREALKQQKAQQSRESLVDQNMQDLYFLEDRTRDMAPGVTGAAGRLISEKVFATKQAENKAIIDRISSRLTLGTLQSMRENSPTGGALGNVSDKDIEILRNAATSLSNTQSPQEFDRELIRLQNLQYDSIHGSEDLLEKKLKSGEITEDQFNSVQANRPVRLLGDRGKVMSRDTQPSKKPSTGLTPEEMELLNKY